MPGELIPIAMFLSIAAVAIFRPLTKRIGLLLEQVYQDKKKESESANLNRVAELMERVVDRIDRLEDRVEFAERMLERRDEGDLRAPLSGSPRQRARSRA